MKSEHSFLDDDDVVEIVPITQKAAFEWIVKTHRHLKKPPRGDVIRVALTLNGEIVGVASAGRPKARGLQDGRTLEITRVAIVPYMENGCSMMYGALRRAGKALGWTRIVTYILESEPGTSLRAAGFRAVKKTAGGEWDCESRPRDKAEQSMPKVRYEWP